MYTPLFSKLNIKVIDSFHKELYWELSNDVSTIINLENVEQIDLAGLQLLVAAKRTYPQITIKSISEEIEETILLCGLDGLLLESKLKDNS